MFGIVAENLRRSTVHVREGGSGVIWRPDLIVTNAHVARRDRRVREAAVRLRTAAAA